MYKAVFNTLVYKPAIYAENIIVVEPALLLVLNVENGEQKIFNVFSEFCQVWQKHYTFASNHVIHRLNQIFKNKTFVLKNNFSLDKEAFNKIISDTIVFEYWLQAPSSNSTRAF